MITITISRTTPKHGEPKRRRQRPWRSIFVGSVAVAIVASGLSWGVPYWHDAPKRAYVEAVRMVTANDPAASSRSDDQIVDTMNSYCDTRASAPMTYDPQYFTPEMQRDRFVAIADEYCAAR